jgi:hypothetical protein
MQQALDRFQGLGLGSPRVLETKFRARWWLGAALVACGCQRSERPQQPDGATQAPQPATASSQPPLSASPAATPLAEPSVSQQAARLPDGGPYLSGGTWISCYQGYRSQSTPERDVIRLSLLCGPYHGLRAMGPPESGTLAESGKPNRHSFTAKRGQCVRIFVAAENAVHALRAALLGPESQPIAKCEGGDGWAVLDPSGALCLETDGTYTLEISAAKGHGGYAVQTWLLP